MSMFHRELAERTADAYSADRYGVNEWQGICLGLLERSYKMEEAEVILRSKYMRWAGDEAKFSNDPERPTARDALYYVDAYKNDIRLMIDTDLS